MFSSFEDFDRFVGLLQVAYQAGFGCDGAMKLNEHLLTDSEFGVEGFLMSACVIEPHES